MVSKYPCPCCGYLTASFPPPTDDICDVCLWHDNAVQFSNPDYRGGPNKVTLNEARDNFRRYGVSDPSKAGRQRRPLADEVPPESGGRGSVAPPQ